MATQPFSHSTAMNQSMQNANRAAAAGVFAVWIFLRFYLMMEIRRFCWHHLRLDYFGGVLLNHALIAVEAALLFALYWPLCRHRVIEKFNPFGNLRRALRWGSGVGIAVSIVSVPVLMHFGMRFSPRFSAAYVLLSFISSAAEEIIYRGILLAAALGLSRSRWLGVLLAALAFGLGHTDYPLLLQVYVAMIGAAFGALYLGTNSLAAPCAAHMVTNLLLDSLFH
jgi:membrane protease YdiL (CAAX protease family)